VAEQTDVVGGSKQQHKTHSKRELSEARMRRCDLALSTEWKEPQTEAERKLTEIWQDVFGIDVVSVLDDFFALGGDSFTATTLAAEIEATFGKRFTPADIITLSTIGEQAECLADANSAAPLPACLVLGRAGGPKPPLFMVHGGKGFAFFKSTFLDIVGEERSIYLFQAPGLDGRTPLESVEEVVTLGDFATLYVDAMRTVQQSGPYHIAAMCAGSFIALEMCNQLEKVGQAVRRLVLLDPTSVPPALKPPAIPAFKEKKRAKKASKQKLAARLVSYFHNSEIDENIEEKNPWDMLPKKLDDLRHRIQRCVEDSKEVPAEQRSYTAERMFKISQQFRAALYQHTPRPYSGNAAMLVTAARAKETLLESGFWRNNLGSLQYEVLGSKHKDLFEQNLVDTARFVKNALT